MARRKSLAGSNTSRARIPLPSPVHGFGPSMQERRRTHGDDYGVHRRPVASMCRRRLVYVRAWAMRRRRHVRGTWSWHTRTPYVRVNYIPKRNGHIYIR